MLHPDAEGSSWCATSAEPARPRARARRLDAEAGHFILRGRWGSGPIGSYRLSGFWVEQPE